MLKFATKKRSVVYIDLVSENHPRATAYWLDNLQANMPLLAQEPEILRANWQEATRAARQATNDLARIVAAARKAGA